MATNLGSTMPNTSSMPMAGSDLYSRDILSEPAQDTPLPVPIGTGEAIFQQNQMAEPECILAAAAVTSKGAAAFTGWADLSIVKTGTPSPVSAGNIVLFMLMLKNDGPDEAGNVTVTDEIPEGLVAPAFSVDSGISWQPWTGVYVMDALAATSSVSILIRGTVSPDAVGTIANTATISSATPDPNPDNNSATVIVPLLATSITKMAAPGLVLPGSAPASTVAADSRAIAVDLDGAGPSAVPSSASLPLSQVFSQAARGGDASPMALSQAMVAIDMPSSAVPQAGVAVDMQSAVLSQAPNGFGMLYSTAEQTEMAVDTQPVEIFQDPNGVGTLYSAVAQTEMAVDAQPLVLSQGPNGVGTQHSALAQVGTAAGAQSSVLPQGSDGVDMLPAAVPQTGIAVGTPSAAPLPSPMAADTLSPALPSAPKSADISIAATGDQNPVQAGNVLTYMLTIVNHGPDEAQQVAITDEVAGGWQSPEYSVDGGAVWQPWTGAYMLDSLVSGQSVTLLLSGTVIPGTVIPGTTSTLINTAKVTSATPDPDPDNNLATVLTPITMLADLAIEKSGAQGSVKAGSVLTYTLQIANHGPDEARDVVVTDEIPEGLLSPDYSIDGGDTWQSWPGTYTFGRLASGSSATFLVRGLVSPAATGYLASTAMVNSPMPDPAPDNNSSTVFTLITELADISIENTGDPHAVQAGNILAYTLVIANHGPDEAQKVTVTDEIPKGLLDPEHSLDGGASWQPWANTCTFERLAPNGSATLLLRGTVSQDAVGYLANTAAVSSPTPDPNPDNNSAVVFTPVAMQADISISNTGDPSSVQAGAMLAYLLQVDNYGPNEAQQVAVADATPEEFMSPEFSTDNGKTWNLWTGTYTIAHLAPESGISLLIRGMVSPAATGVLANTATVSSPMADPNPDNNSSTVFTPVTMQADLSIAKTGDRSQVQAGNDLTYTLTAVNHGPNEAKNVTVTDEIAGGLLSPEYSLDGGASWQPWHNTYATERLAPGDSIILLIRGTVSPAATDILTSTATVGSATPDPDSDNNSAAVFTRVTKMADISIEKTSDKSQIQVGNALTYTLVIANQGPNEAHNVTVTDEAADGLLSPEYSLDGGTAWQPWPGTYTFEYLAQGSSATVLLRGTVSPTAAGYLTNTATVNSPVLDPDPNNNSATVITPVTMLADLAITNIGDPSAVRTGGTLAYSLQVVNYGPNDAWNVMVTGEIPDGWLSPEYSTDGGASWRPWSGIYTLDHLARGHNVTLLLRGFVDLATAGYLANTATVNSPTPDPDPSNNSATAITPVMVSADIAIQNIGSQSPVRGGETLTYTLDISNYGPNEACQVAVIDPTPEGLIFPEYSIDKGKTWKPWIGTWMVGNLDKDSSVTLLIRGTVSSAIGGVLANTATAVSLTADPNPDNNSSTALTPVTVLADLSITCVGDQASVRAGNFLTYTLTAANHGPNEAKDVTVTDEITGGLSSPEYSLDGGENWLPWPKSYTFDRFAPGSSAKVLIRGTIVPGAAGVLANTAVIGSSVPDPNPGNNSSTVLTPIIATADLTITKTGNQSPVQAGNILAYTLTAANRGPNEAHNVTMTDITPDALLNPEYSIDSGQSWQAWPGTYTLATLAAGSNTTIVIRGTVSPSATGTLANTATVSSTTPDPNPDNNSFAVLTPITSFTDLAITQAAYPDTLSPSGIVTYALTVLNRGPLEAVDVVASDDIPKEIYNSIYSLDGGGTWHTWKGSLEIGAIAAGTQMEILLRGVVSGSAKGTVTNVAEVRSSTADSDLSNNSSSAVVEVIGGI